MQKKKNGVIGKFFFHKMSQNEWITVQLNKQTRANPELN